MIETLTMRKDGRLLTLPVDDWERQVAAMPQETAEALEFMSEMHHRVRSFTVRELPRLGKPLPAELIAERLNLTISRVSQILEELESNLFFLFRNEQGAVSWAYPVTADSTPHHAHFSTGERLDAA